MTDPKPPINRTRSRIQLSLLGLMFFAPFVLAYSAYWVFPGWTPAGRVNYGQLLSPTRPTPAFALRDAEGKPIETNPFRDKWVLVQTLTQDCDDACRRELVLTRQTVAALGVKRERMLRVLIAADGVDIAALKARYGAEQPNLLWLQDAPGNPAITFFAGPAPSSVMLVDPLGTWLMTYPHAANDEAVKSDFKGMQKDINKLLRLSSIG